MIWLGNLLVSLVASIVAYLGLSLSKKTLFATAAITGFIALTTAFIAVVKGLMVAIQYSMPSWIAPGFYVLPSNVAACLGAYVAARIARSIYNYHVETLKLASYIT
jgi:hypothetical protein